MAGALAWLNGLRRHFAEQRNRRARRRSSCVRFGCVESPGGYCVLCEATGKRLIAPPRRT